MCGPIGRLRVCTGSAEQKVNARKRATSNYTGLLWVHEIAPHRQEVTHKVKSFTSRKNMFWINSFHISDKMGLLTLIPTILNPITVSYTSMLANCCSHTALLLLPQTKYLYATQRNRNFVDEIKFWPLDVKRLPLTIFFFSEFTPNVFPINALIRPVGCRNERASFLPQLKGGVSVRIV